MSQTTNEPGFDTGTPTPPPRPPWYRHWYTWAALAALIAGAAAGGIAVAAQGHPAAHPAPARTSAPAPSTQAPQPSSPPASTPSEADQVIAWRDSGGSAVLKPISPDMQALTTDDQTLVTDLRNGDMASAEGSGAQALMNDGTKMSADASAALADPPPGSLAASWTAAMTQLQTAGKDCVRVASDLENDDITATATDAATLNTDFGNATAALEQAVTQVQQVTGQG
jgi:hypothetical protein